MKAKRELVLDEAVNGVSIGGGGEVIDVEVEVRVGKGVGVGVGVGMNGLMTVP